MLPKAVLKTEPDGTATLRVEGEWNLDSLLENRAELIDSFTTPSFKKVIFTAGDVDSWDSSLIAFLVHLIGLCRKNNIDCDKNSLPDGMKQLIDLAFAVAPRQGAERRTEKQPFLNRVGEKTILCWTSFISTLDFTQQSCDSIGRYLTRKAVMRKSDLMLEIQEAGIGALAIVSLICFMVGLILAFIGAVQLRLFGAQIYVASLVAIAMSRVMGAVMAGIIMAGRTGSSYAAILGSMQVNEETDALKTMGISPFDFLVLPRLLALSLMMPLLTVYADFMGIMGGAFVGIFMLDLSPYEYFKMTLNALSMKNIIIGIIHGGVFGVIISLCGCYKGINSGRSALAVGDATTAAVVNSIVGIIIATAIITFICNMIGV